MSLSRRVASIHGITMNRKMRPPGRAWTPLFAALLLVAGRSPSEAQIRYPGYIPSFPAPAPAIGVGPGGGPGVWLGGDGGFLCALDSEDSFWTFCDFAVGPIGSKTRLDATSHKKRLDLGNSVAIATCRDGIFSVQHYFRGTALAPEPFFADPNNPAHDPVGSRLWPRKALLHNGRLYIFAHQVRGGGGVYNTFIIRVNNPHRPPGDWLYDYLRVGNFAPPVVGVASTPSPVYFGSEALLDEPHNRLYAFGIKADYNPADGGFSNTFEVTALRIPLDAIEDAPAGTDLAPVSESMTSRFGTWKPGLIDPNDYYKVGIPAFNSFSVRGNASLGVWQAVFSRDQAKGKYLAGRLPASDPTVSGVYAMAGKSAFGPWGQPVRIAEIPEMDPGRVRLTDRGYDPDSYAYFVGEKEAFEFWDGQIVFTYSVGSYQFGHGRNFTHIDSDMKQYTIYPWAAPNPFFHRGPGTSSGVKQAR